MLISCIAKLEYNSFYAIRVGRYAYPKTKVYCQSLRCAEKELVLVIKPLLNKYKEEAKKN